LEIFLKKYFFRIQKKNLKKNKKKQKLKSLKNDEPQTLSDCGDDSGLSDK
jgi:hypothetical protein